MYTTSSPILLRSLNAETRPIYLKQLKEAQVDRIFITLVEFCKDEDAERDLIASLRENLSYFSENGIEAAVWMGTTIGHGVPLAGVDQKSSFSDAVRIVNFNGEALDDTRCPLHDSVRQTIARQIAVIARSGVKTILLDDDFRMSHGSHPCCACDLHISYIQKLCGEELDREKLEQLIFHSPVNKYRAAWIRAQGDGLRMLAKEIRAAVDAVDPDVQLALCSCPCLWEMDGCDAVELATILAGRNKPLVRIFEAPYVATVNKRRLPMIFERARMAAHIAKTNGVELLAEGDVYPRPRYNVPASYLELFDALIGADGTCDGILKYMFDYASTPLYETGYLERHIQNQPLRKELFSIFAGKTACGVKTPKKAHLFDHSDLTLSRNSRYQPYPVANGMLSYNTIPTTFEGEGVCHAVFGEDARHVDLSDLKKGAVLDAISALLLLERGVDVGIESKGVFQDTTAAYLISADLSERTTVRPGEVRYYMPTLKFGATVLEYCEIDGAVLPFAYRYENADGQRFLVYLFDAIANLNTGMERGYLHQRILTEQIEWIARQPLPATCQGNPELYMLCKQDERSLSVALFNCYADSVLKPTIKLGQEYQNIRFVNTSGALNCDTVVLDRPIPAFEYVAFEVSK